TNGVGTCLQEHRPLSVVMGDHFSTRNTTLTCTVTPLFGSEGELIGILDVSTARPADYDSQKIMQEIVGAATRRIENLYFAHRHTTHAILRLSRSGDFADMATEVRIAVDAIGRIVEMGSHAGQWLQGPAVNEGDGVKKDGLVGRPIEQMLGLKLEDLLAADGALSIPGLRGPSFYARLEEPRRRREPIRSDGGRSAGQRSPGRPVGNDASHDHVAMHRSAERVQSRDALDYDLVALAGSDPAMLANIDIARRVVDRGLPILLHGETGSGKGLFAKALHQASARAGRAFVTVNCAAIPRELIESELFGYRPGAFTGAAATGFKGRLTEANGGTLFLDEVGDMPLALQTRLLQVLSEREFTPVGAVKPVALDVAVISATLHDLSARVRNGQFREDLFFRLSGATLGLPALRQRTDRAMLIERMIAEEAEQASCRITAGAETMQMLLAYYWPGNLRELRHALRFAIALADNPGTTASDMLLPRHLPPLFQSMPAQNAGDPAPGSTRAATEARMIRVALDRTGWNVTATAVLLDVSRATLHRKIRRYGLARA
ncbi:MAG: sigma-54-dependent Fis family transcriptional regulator, partial [Dongiaceae bacterium]